jgi:phosphate transport system substrate-binding protein
MRSQASLALAVALLATVACGEKAPATPAVAAELRYDGATSISQTILADAIPLLRARTGVALRVDRGGSGVGLRRVLAGEVDVAGVARALTAPELAHQPYFQIIGYDALGVFVDEASPIRALTRAQVKAIFTGRATSWSSLGGKEQPVRPCTERRGSGRATLESVQAEVLDGEPYGNFTELEDPKDCVAWVARTPGAVTVATTAFRIPGVRPVQVDGVEPTPPNVRSGRYLLTRPLLLVSRQQPEGALAQLFELALSPEGQALVAKAGFVPAR